MTRVDVVAPSNDGRGMTSVDVVWPCLSPHAFPDECSEDPGSSTPEPHSSCRNACDYWIPACAGKATGGKVATTSDQFPNEAMANTETLTHFVMPWLDHGIHAVASP
ncbi:hypothetical protein [Roseibium polysiphoniae]|uniref:hypothetical protein n=1 Tax=Roseibium polysiphoniae TaxID=2571221 RepID=UPI00329A1C28